MSNDKKLRELLKVKRLETPGKAYFDAFLDEFHRYQRADLLKEPGFWERFVERVHELLLWRARPVMAMAGSFAAVLVLAGVMGISEWRHQGGDRDASGHQIDFANASEFFADPAEQQPELKLASLSSFEEDFDSPRYVTGRATLAYDTSLAF